MLRADFPNISSVSIASCPLGDFFTAQCAEIGGCLQKCLPCVVYEVKKIWQKAGIPFINTDKHISFYKFKIFSLIQFRIYVI